MANETSPQPLDPFYAELKASGLNLNTDEAAKALEIWQIRQSIVTFVDTRPVLWQDVPNSIVGLDSGIIQKRGIDSANVILLARELVIGSSNRACSGFDTAAGDYYNMALQIKEMMQDLTNFNRRFAESKLNPKLAQANLRKAYKVWQIMQKLLPSLYAKHGDTRLEIAELIQTRLGEIEAVPGDGGHPVLFVRELLNGSTGRECSELDTKDEDYYKLALEVEAIALAALAEDEAVKK